MLFIAFCGFAEVLLACTVLVFKLYFLYNACKWYLYDLAFVNGFLLFWNIAAVSKKDKYFRSKSIHFYLF